MSSVPPPLPPFHQPVGQPSHVQRGSLQDHFLSKESVLVIFVTGLSLIGFSYAARAYSVTPYSAISGACLVTASFVFTIFLRFFNRTFEDCQLKVSEITQSLATVKEQRTQAEESLRRLATEKAEVEASLSTTEQARSTAAEDCKSLRQLLDQADEERGRLQRDLERQTAEIVVVIREKDTADALRQKAEELAGATEKRVETKFLRMLSFIRGERDSQEVKTELEESRGAAQAQIRYFHPLKEKWEVDVALYRRHREFYRQFLEFLETTPATEKTDCFKQGSLSFTRSSFVYYSEGKEWAAAISNIFARLLECSVEKEVLVGERIALGSNPRSASDHCNFGLRKYVNYSKSCSVAIQELDRLIDILNKKLVSFEKRGDAYREARTLFGGFAKRGGSEPLDEETLSILFDLFGEREFKEKRRGESEAIAFEALSEKYLQDFKVLEENLQKYRELLEEAKQTRRNFEKDKIETELNIEFFRSYGPPL